MAPTPQQIPESDHQKQCVEYAERAGWGHLLICIPNGTWLPGDARTRAIYANHLKKMGLRPGASDLFLAKPVRRQNWPPDVGGGDYWHGAWFELKRTRGPKGGGNHPTEEQIAFLLNMSKEGYYADVCYGFSEWQRSVANYFAGNEPLWTSCQEAHQKTK